ncbi:hypothetical protein B0H13DRAFT_433022 [Mycena leptocephala]|nr:hypothetical protein B0H13DRAFT_433022 [Mycena leptocephala]
MPLITSACLFARITCIQPDVAVLVPVEPGSNVKRNRSKPLVSGIAFLGLNRMVYCSCFPCSMCHFTGEAFISSLFTPSL